MLGRLPLALLALALPACFAGAPPKGLCDADDDCDAPQVCVAHHCRPGCTGSDQCAATEACIDRTCQPYEAACDEVTPCLAAFFCDAGRCARPRALGEACADPSGCTSGVCAQGVCCDEACGGLCESCLAAHTGGRDGECKLALRGEDPGDQCGSIFACDGKGSCTRPNGATCAADSDCLFEHCSADGVCCEEACTGACRACVASLTGERSGECAAVLAGRERSSGCAGGTACDGAGACSAVALGAACDADWQCASGFCADGVCCERACDGVCEVCGIGGACQAKLSGPDLGTCDSAHVVGSCSAAPCECVSGTCAPGAGTPCDESSPCLHCVDGYCCDSACSGACQACSSAYTGEASGTCAPIAAGTDPLGDCSGATACNGAGACYADALGASCGDGRTCGSGYCVDGVCCNSACTESCATCDGAQSTTTAGACGYIVAGQDPDGECPAALTCATGSCYVEAERTSCSLDSQCTSQACCGGVCRAEWTAIGPEGVGVNAVWARSETDVYAATNQNIHHFDGQRWQVVATLAAPSALVAMHGADGHIVAAAADGTILRLADGVWTELASPTTGILSSVVVADSVTFYVGFSSADLLYRWQSGVWQQIATGTGARWLSLWKRGTSIVAGGGYLTGTTFKYCNAGRLGVVAGTTYVAQTWTRGCIRSGAGTGTGDDLIAASTGPWEPSAVTLTSSEVVQHGASDTVLFTGDYFNRVAAGSDFMVAYGKSTTARVLRWKRGNAPWASAPLEVDVNQASIAGLCGALLATAASVFKY